MAEGRPKIMKPTPKSMLRREKVQVAPVLELPDARAHHSATPVTHCIHDALRDPRGGSAVRSTRPGHSASLRPSMELEGKLAGGTHGALQT
eukprot:7813406-Alexandrium_andersonii.AAC.1